MKRCAFSMVPVEIKTESIRLAQLLKLAGLVEDGTDAKCRISGKEVRVNGSVEIRRGRKLRVGDQVEFADETYEVVARGAPR